VKTADLKTADLDPSAGETTAAFNVTDRYWRSGSTARRLSDPVTWAALCNAPVGRDPLLEVAYAWHERPERKPVPAQSRYVPMFSVEVDGLAARLARLLAPLTWAIVVPADPAPKAVWAREWVQVPRTAYPRVLRSLNSAWRRRLLPGQAGGESRQAAIALWRIAILTGGYEGPDGVLVVRARTSAAAQTLTRTARLLQIQAVPVAGDRDTTVIIRDPFQISHLLTAAGPDPRRMA
jgi:hypothetical protein